MSFQDASNSSATSCAIVLAMCWPMSALATVTTTLPSLPIAYQTAGSILAVVAPNASLISGSAAYPNTRPVAAVPTIKLRRLRFRGPSIF